ncbi:MAG: hypothetical protein R2941_13215 [Desulfobacterales bacterium]
MITLIDEGGKMLRLHLLVVDIGSDISVFGGGRTEKYGNVVIRSQRTSERYNLDVSCFFVVYGFLA